MKAFVVLGLVLLFGACSSPAPVKSQEYAKLRTEKTFEHDLPIVWQGIEEAVRDHKISQRVPAEVDGEKSLETDWVVSQSKNKYYSYTVNGFPRRRYLQIRYKHLITARKVVGGTHVDVDTSEEVENLKTDGSSDGFSRAETADSSRGKELIDKINISILSASH